MFQFNLYNFSIFLFLQTSSNTDLFPVKFHQISFYFSLPNFVKYYSTYFYQVSSDTDSLPIELRQTLIHFSSNFIEYFSTRSHRTSSNIDLTPRSTSPLFPVKFHQILVHSFPSNFVKYRPTFSPNFLKHSSTLVHRCELVDRAFRIE